eukprot:gnl/MRDRNA2_/MRDRNA2_101757_c0_seq1.p1 gnl/MRDRNA2_/MRDRNA2_101757_c0~~gnl/MRDRNA2_/MRDRNA2_101757_c0_seq1.p1  ORF type:complete len:2150 (+),score=483.21 gnl/MRDRNA2_/MRDRNA2_101757_c0_seq1:798-6452(+)
MAVEEDEQEAHIQFTQMLERWEKLFSQKPLTFDLSKSAPPKVEEQEGQVDKVDGEALKVEPREDSFLPQNPEAENLTLFEPQREDIVGRLVKGLALNAEACHSWMNAQMECNPVLDGEQHERAAEVLDYLDRIEAEWSSTANVQDDELSGESSDELPEWGSTGAARPTVSMRATRILDKMQDEEDAKEPIPAKGGLESPRLLPKYEFEDLGEERIAMQHFTVAQAQLQAPISGGVLNAIMNQASGADEARQTCLCCNRVRELVKQFLGVGLDGRPTVSQEALSCTAVQIWGINAMKASKLAPGGDKVSTRLSAVLMGTEAAKTLARIELARLSKIEEEEQAVKKKSAMAHRAKMTSPVNVSSGQRMAERAARRAQRLQGAMLVKTDSAKNMFHMDPSVAEEPQSPGGHPGSPSLSGYNLSGKATCVLKPSLSKNEKGGKAKNISVKAKIGTADFKDMVDSLPSLGDSSDPNEESGRSQMPDIGSKSEGVQKFALKRVRSDVFDMAKKTKVSIEADSSGENKSSPHTTNVEEDKVSEASNSPRTVGKSGASDKDDKSDKTPDEAVKGSSSPTAKPDAATPKADVVHHANADHVSVDEDQLAEAAMTCHRQSRKRAKKITTRIHQMIDHAIDLPQTSNSESDAPAPKYSLGEAEVHELLRYVKELEATYEDDELDHLLQSMPVSQQGSDEHSEMDQLRSVTSKAKPMSPHGSARTAPLRKMVKEVGAKDGTTRSLGISDLRALQVKQKQTSTPRENAHQREANTQGSVDVNRKDGRRYQSSDSEDELYMTGRLRETVDTAMQTVTISPVVQKTQMCQTEAPDVDRMEFTRRLKHKLKKNKAPRKSATMPHVDETIDLEEGDEECTYVRRKEQTIIDVGGDNTKVMNVGRMKSFATDLDDDSDEDWHNTNRGCDDEEDPPIFPGMIVRIIHPEPEFNGKMAKAVDIPNPDKDEWTIELMEAGTHHVLHQSHLNPIPETELDDQQRKQVRKSRRQMKEIRKSKRAQSDQNKEASDFEDKTQAVSEAVRISQGTIMGTKQKQSVAGADPYRNPLKKKEKKRKAKSVAGFFKGLDNVDEMSDDEVAETTTSRDLTGKRMTVLPIEESINVAMDDIDAHESQELARPTIVAGNLKQPSTKHFDKQISDHTDQIKTIQLAHRHAEQTRPEAKSPQSVSDDDSAESEDDNNVEIIDCATQSACVWDSLPNQFVEWMKLNLMQRQQAEFYCTPWDVTELELFPNLCEPKKRLKFIKDFEDFLFEVMRLSRPTKHQARRKLRERYRSEGTVHGTGGELSTCADEPAPEPSADRTPDECDVLQTSAIVGNQDHCMPWVKASNAFGKASSAFGPAVHHERAACASVQLGHPTCENEDLTLHASLKGVDAALGFHVPGKPFGNDCELKQDPYQFEYAAAEGLAVPDEAIEELQTVVEGVDSSPKLDSDASLVPSRPTAPAPRGGRHGRLPYERPSAPVPSKKQLKKAGELAKGRVLKSQGSSEESVETFPFQKPPSHFCVAAAKPSASPPSTFWPEVPVRQTDAELRRDKMLKQQVQMSAIRNHDLPLPHQEVDQWLTHLNAVDQGIRNLLDIAQGEANREDLMSRLLPLTTWLDQQKSESPCQEVQEAVDALEAADAKASHELAQQEADTVLDAPQMDLGRLESDQDDISPASELSQHRAVEADRQQRPIQQPPQQETAAQQQEKEPAKVGKMHVIKDMDGTLKDDINPLGVRYPVHGAYTIGKRPSVAPQQCYLGAVAWSYGGTDKEAKKVKEYVPTTAESGSTRPSWSRQRERDMMRMLKPIVAGSSKPQIDLSTMHEVEITDPKAAKGVDDQLNLPTIQGSTRASGIKGKQSKVLAGQNCALPTLHDIVPSSGSKFKKRCNSRASHDAGSRSAR